MEGAPENCPVPVAFHPNRRTENFFGGGEDIDVHVACDLLSSQGSIRLDAQQVGDGGQGFANQGTQLGAVVWLAAMATRMSNAARVLMSDLLGMG